MNISRIKQLYTVIEAFLASVNQQWQDLRDKEIHDRYHQLYEMAKDACEDPDFSDYVPNIPYWFSMGGNGKLLREHAIVITSSGAQLLSYLKQVLEREHIPNNKEVEVLGPNNRKVFVVHGRNEKIKNSVFNLLRSIGVEPIEWGEAKRLTRKATPFIGEVLSVAFSHAQAIIVLFTPDDVAKLQEEYASDSEPEYELQLTPQARPNVIFEAGMAFGYCEDRTIMIEFGKLRPFSDISGRHVLRFKGSPEDRVSLIDALRVSGVEVNIEGKTDWLTVGDFTL